MQKVLDPFIFLAMDVQGVFIIEILIQWFFYLGLLVNANTDDGKWSRYYLSFCYTAIIVQSLAQQVVMALR